MNRTVAAAVVLVAVVLPLALSGCTPDAAEPASSGIASTQVGSTPAASPGQQVASPTIVAPEDLDGTEVSVVIGAALVIAVPDGAEAEWTGGTTDPSIAEFSRGGPSEGAVFRPGFVARAVGVTPATMTGPDGREFSFTLSVKAP